MDQLAKRAETLSSELQQISDKLNLAQQETELQALRSRISAPDFWQDNKTAQEVSKAEADLARRVEPWLKLQTQTSELKELIGLNDESMRAEITTQLDKLESELAELKKELRFQGPFDSHDVILSIYAGAGGTDAQDWAQMLLRMYTRWAENQELRVQTIEISPGEHGVHRLVRQSPFNSAASRETSFAKVDILPVIDKPDDVQIDDKDLKIDVFRAGGRGGQSVNTTDSAVRITHLPTGITVAIQNERSQLQNKDTAMTILRSRLAQLQLEQHAETVADVKGPNQSAEFGNQIRNYVLHPYKQVKDTRTGYETSDPQKVLDGDLDPLIDTWLEQVSH
jgi:peptide chain release factor 2